jgi:hypothetical protein
MKTKLNTFAEKIRAEKSLVEEKYAPQIRNHILQIFNKAKIKDKKLEGVKVICGIVFLNGFYRTNYGSDEKVEFFNWRDYNQDCWPEFEETQFLFDILREYEQGLCSEFPYIENIK